MGLFGCMGIISYWVGMYTYLSLCFTYLLFLVLFTVVSELIQNILKSLPTLIGGTLLGTFLEARFMLTEKLDINIGNKNGLFPKTNKIGIQNNFFGVESPESAKKKNPIQHDVQEILDANEELIFREFRALYEKNNFVSSKFREHFRTATNYAKVGDYKNACTDYFLAFKDTPLDKFFLEIPDTEKYSFDAHLKQLESEDEQSFSDMNAYLRKLIRKHV